MRQVFQLLLLCAVVAAAGLIDTGCSKPRDAIMVSNDTLDFSRNELPLVMFVWNTNADIASLTVDVTPSDAWIQTDVKLVTSAKPTDAQTFDKKAVTVSIDRRLLNAGTHEGEIVFSAPGINSQTVKVTVIQDQNGQQDALNFVNPVFHYEAPYLLDFSFGLHDQLGNSVVAEPAQFDVTARESGVPVGAETGVLLKRAASRQLRANLVLDYTLSMQQSPGAIQAMQGAAQNVFLPALNEDAQVAVTEFHRDDAASMQVADFTVDRPFLINRISAIQSQFVQGFASGSRMLDALVDAAQSFGAGQSSAEDRYIILFSDGNDTSSTHTTDDVANAAKSRGIRIYAIGFGANVNITTMLNITGRTGGAYFPAQSSAQLEDTFRRIVADLEGQYTLRWASLKRVGTPVTPSFTITINGQSATFNANQDFVATKYSGDVLRGVLKFVPSDNTTQSTVFLRAEYVPREIHRIRLFVHSTAGFTVSIVSAADSGLLGGWTLTTTDDAVSGGKWIDITGPRDAIPFATFGPLLRFNFDTLAPDPSTLFDQAFTDNTIYANGQSFVVVGFPATSKSLAEKILEIAASPE